MAAVKAGHKAVYHSEHGDVPAWVIEYDEGREQGDYLIGGFWNTAGREAGRGDTFVVRSVVGHEQGAFTPHS